MYVAPSQGYDEPVDRCYPFERDQPVYMVGHEGIDVERAALLFQRFAQPVQVGLVVFLAKEAGFAVVSTLNDVQGYVIKVNVGAAWHTRTPAEIQIYSSLVTLLATSNEVSPCRKKKKGLNLN